ncbi:hypothetical protein [Heyndrickxia acidicola]|uniref:Apea-like HEPN domain-containing protein n=1 Tax=Heyndrickxia acidicola TaxID=209389 RepID=A0ABU6MM86_9BACI|nr:hypothetical protein [Heyndrickxia acidicola]MED1205614.1 hypothetical protein [Heyndrickxia acidicola]
MLNLSTIIEQFPDLKGVLEKTLSIFKEASLPLTEEDIKIFLLEFNEQFDDDKNLEEQIDTFAKKKIKEIKNHSLSMELRNYANIDLFDSLFSEENMNPLAENMSSLVVEGNLEPFLFKLKSLHNELTRELEIFEHIDIETNIKSLDFYSKRKEIQNMFLNEKWFPDINLEPKIIVELLHHYREQPTQFLKTSYMNQEMINMYNEETVFRWYDEWSKESTLSEELIILKTAIESHFKKEYIISIHLIIPRIESLIVSVNKLKGNVDFKDLRKVIGEKKRHTLSRSKVLLLEICIKYLNKTFLNSFEHGRENFLNRNSVLHGAYKGTFTEVESLKLLAFYNLLFEVLK